jgi:hypothetical protein
LLLCAPLPTLLSLSVVLAGSSIIQTFMTARD